MTLDQIIQAMKKEFEDSQKNWVLKEMKGYRKNLESPGAWKIKLLWDNDEELWEHVHSIRDDDTLSLVPYAHDNNLAKPMDGSRLRNIKYLFTNSPNSSLGSMF